MARPRARGSPRTNSPRFSASRSLSSRYVDLHKGYKLGQLSLGLALVAVILGACVFIAITLTHRDLSTMLDHPDTLSFSVLFATIIGSSAGVYAGLIGFQAQRVLPSTPFTRLAGEDADRTKMARASARLGVCVCAGEAVVWSFFMRSFDPIALFGSFAALLTAQSARQRERGS
jgi:hypothetical protein